ncbi:MAG: acetyl-CoA carboxylase biotin carboxyl carrier protein subunit [Flavobacterium sp. MedPE-SWcel]|uniref:acetyl-CoA carboxylase biotin carboxyl carrier protein subunit n=1 Tax=uncultured Flavobacterium sp. TaxID=165435 RepID=UPI00090F9054|nr:acetyl-CoA carboxylase biotin carboxyl carrier protein subunit [uncultured Flavobacterium sp.]OIQ16030.1 MAG: acetyl-CoA carboxylase biotin carboxyl carrier protein subunit [Flavobacterium sp. MedPE-SWcel]
MSHAYKLTVNGTTAFDVNEEQLSQLDAISTAPSHYHILKDNKPFKAAVTDANFLAKEYTVTINNNTYTVNIANTLDQLIKEMGFEIGAAKQVNEIKAPIPGLILEINVTVGQEVQENDDLLILEAMKMENTFQSPRAGVIKSIAINKGDAVDKGQLLIEFE